MIPNIGATEMVILLIVVLLLFGAKRIPELAKGLGTGVREFRDGVSGRGETGKARGSDEPSGLPRAEELGSEQSCSESGDAHARQRI